MAQNFLEIVNSDIAIRPYLTIYPFEIRNIDIILFIKDTNGIRLDDPHIGIAEISVGRLAYHNLITTDIPNYKSEFVETYEEALKEPSQKNN